MDAAHGATLKAGHGWEGYTGLSKGLKDTFAHVSGGLGYGHTENLASVHQWQIESGDRVWSVGEERDLLLCQAKERTQLLPLKNHVSHSGGIW